MREEILAYLRRTYAPLAILLYGSFADGTQDDTSDFDCMLLLKSKEKKHDDAVIAGVKLDCFLFTEKEAESEDIEAFLTAYDAEIVQDTDGIAARLQQRVRQYVAENTVQPPEEKAFIAAWIEKTMRRAQKNDDEGNYRAAGFLGESLTDYCFLRDRFYFGSKKTVRYLQQNDPAGYALFHRAVTSKTPEDITRWAEYVIAPQKNKETE